MNPFVLHHEPKSRFAYQYDHETIHLRLTAAKDSVTSVEVLYGDPFLWGPADNDPSTWEWKREDNNSAMKLEYKTADLDHFFLAVTPQTKRMRYAFLINKTHLFGCQEIVDIRQDPSALSNHFNYYNFPFMNEEDMFQAPSWVQHQVWYSIFPERFANGDSSINPDGTLPWGDTDSYSNHQRFGGDLQGIIDHLDYIQDAGFTGIYMTPIFPSDSAHKYDVNDYFDIDPAFGNKETFKTLVEEVHQRGMKIMLDAVFNHCGFRHPYFQDVVRQGKDSSYYDCFYVIDKDKPLLSFDVNDDGTINRASTKRVYKDKSLLNYRTFAFTPYMPKMRTTHPLMKKHLLDAASYWITEFDIDGWRLDVSDEVAHSFWREFRTVVKAAKQDAYIIGENWSSGIPWLGGDQYDGIMNYELLFPMWDYFGVHPTRTTSTGQRFIYQVNHVLSTYPKNVLQSLYNLVDSHDTTRILQVCGNDIKRVKLPYLFLFSFPGAPSVYYGGEIGLSGEHDPDNRRCMVWEEAHQQQELKQHIKTLIRLRREYDAFRDPDIQWHNQSTTTDVLLYQKGDIVFALNRSTDSQTISVPPSLQQQRYTELYHEKTVDIDTTLQLEPFGFAILQPKK